MNAIHNQAARVLESAISARNYAAMLLSPAADDGDFEPGELAAKARAWRRLMRSRALQWRNMLMAVSAPRSEALRLSNG